MRGRNQTVNNLAMRLRRAGTDAEKVLWGCLRNRALGGHKFVRQAPVGNYVADFLCRECRLVIEADGSQHYDSESDETRDAWLLSQGYAVLHLSNSIILGQRSSAIETITAALDGTLKAVAGYEMSFKTPAS